MLATGRGPGVPTAAAEVGCGGGSPAGGAAVVGGACAAEWPASSADRSTQPSVEAASAVDAMTMNGMYDWLRIEERYTG